MRKTLIKKYLNAGTLDYSTINGLEVAPVDAVLSAVYWDKKAADQLVAEAEHQRLTEEQHEKTIMDMIASDEAEYQKYPLSVLEQINYANAMNDISGMDGIQVRTFADHPYTALLTNKYGKELLITPRVPELLSQVGKFALSGSDLEFMDKNVELRALTLTPEMLAYFTEQGRKEAEWQERKKLEEQGNLVAMAAAMTLPFIASLYTPLAPYVDGALFLDGAYGLATLEEPIGLNAPTFWNTMNMLPTTLRGLNTVMHTAPAMKAMAAIDRTADRLHLNLPKYLSRRSLLEYYKTRARDRALAAGKYSNAAGNRVATQTVLNGEARSASQLRIPEQRDRLQNQLYEAAEKAAQHKKPINVELATPEQIQDAINAARERLATRLGPARIFDIPEEATITVMPDKTIIYNNDATLALGPEGTFDAIDLKTGKRTPITLTGNETVINAKVKYPHLSNASASPTGTHYGSAESVVSGGSSELGTLPAASPESAAIAKSNIEYIQNEVIPGCKVSGSTALRSTETGIVAPSDNDIYVTLELFNKFKAKHPEITTTLEGETYGASLNSEYGHLGDLDLNVIDVDSHGYGNGRALEIYRQFFPEEYHLAVERAASKKDAIQILGKDGKPLTNQQLLDAIDPVQKSVMDSMEVDWTRPNKEKHRMRFFNYLIGKNTDAVHEALVKAANMELGGKGRLLPKFELGTREEQIAMLKDVGYPEDIALKLVNRGDAAVRNAMDYWYLSDCTLFRASDAVNSTTGARSAELLEKNFVELNPEASRGGEAAGAGKNYTIRGDSGHSAEVFGHVQIGIPELVDGMNPTDMIKLIRERLFSEGSLTADQAKYINDLLGTSFTEGTNLQNAFKKVSDVIDRNPDRAKIYLDILSKLGIKSWSGGSRYGRGIYTGVGNLDLENGDVLGYMAGKSSMERFPTTGVKALHNRATVKPPSFNPDLFLRTRTKIVDVTDPRLEDYERIYKAREALRLKRSQELDDAIKAFDANEDLIAEHLKWVTLPGIGTALLTPVGIAIKDSIATKGYTDSPYFDKYIEESSGLYEKYGKPDPDEDPEKFDEYIKADRELDNHYMDLYRHNKDIDSKQKGGIISSRYNFYKNRLKSLRYN